MAQSYHSHADPSLSIPTPCAYDKAIVANGSTPEVVWEVIAEHIIRLIAESERDRNVLYERALASAGFSA